MPKKTLKKSLGLLDVYAIATGATLSAGFFLLPGLAAQKAGPALIVSYLLAVVPLVPAMFSMVELMTAMPRAGGIYYFLDRSLGPLLGTIGGIGTWMVLILKVSFALVGMGAYLALFLPELPIIPVAVGLAVAVGFLNVYGAKLTGTFQIILLVGLLAILAVFIGGGLPNLDGAHFRDFFGKGAGAVFATAGLVYVSYVGMTKVASISEEVKDPERNLPLGTFLALGTAIVIYGVGTTVIVGAVPVERLARGHGDLTSVATAAGALFGTWGSALLTVAAILAFTAVANAGTFSASRYPLSMSRDRVLPAFIQRLNEQGLPARAIALTVGVLVAVIVLLNPLEIAKLASVFQLLVFSLVCLAVIVMRESEIDSYDPGFRSPFYPWTQLFGMVAPLALIAVMGWESVLFSAGLIAFSTAWYFAYARGKTPRAGAVYHLFERLGRQRHDSLNQELREILKEKGLREDDPFGETIARGQLIDYEAPASFEEIVREAARRLAERLNADADALAGTFLKETKLGIVPVSHGAALLHLRLPDLDAPHVLLVRARQGVELSVGRLKGETAVPQSVHALFFLVSPDEHPRQHLRLLARLAGRIEDQDFLSTWREADGEQHLKEVLLRDERFLALRLRADGATAAFIGQPARDAALPEGSFVALIRRHGQTLTLRDDTVLRQGDRLTVAGTPQSLKRLREQYATSD